ncbi:hypothetical protein [Streptomyces roseoverticillatus]|uniref:hypothetical protein n=1 Tax=Streptomyces roseoverticillatus TaxID=66429 RepID=UPI000B0382E5|nr:hypothetical protein [Streptomyces roseoverticillatus]
MPMRVPLSTYRSRAAGVTAGCALALALSTAGIAGPAPVAAAQPKQYTAAQVRSFLVKFYGQHGPSASDRIHKVDAELRRRAAAAKGQDVLLCARSTPRHIVVGKVTAEPSGMGWATVTTRWKAGPDKHLTAYVGLKGSLPLKLYDVTCDG